MPSDCIYDCRHPLWGGKGFCTEDHDSTGAGDETCSCSVGFVSRNSIGNPSCVPKRVLVVTYSVLAAMTATVTVLLVWNALQYRHLPARKRTRKAMLRLRVILSGRCGRFLSWVYDWQRTARLLFSRGFDVYRMLCHVPQ